MFNVDKISETAFSRFQLKLNKEREVKLNTDDMFYSFLSGHGGHSSSSVDSAGNDSPEIKAQIYSKTSLLLTNWRIKRVSFVGIIIIISCYCSVCLF